MNSLFIFSFFVSVLYQVSGCYTQNVAFNPRLVPVKYHVDAIQKFISSIGNTETQVSHYNDKLSYLITN